MESHLQVRCFGILSSARDVMPCSVLMHMFFGLCEANGTGALGGEHSSSFSNKALGSHIKHETNYLFANVSGK